MSAPAASNRISEFPFLGTLAGNQTYLPAGENKTTYGRVYTPFGGTDVLRKKMNTLFVSTSETIAFSNSTVFEHGGYFYARNLLEGKAQHLSSSQYAISRVGAQLEKVTKLPIEEILNQCSAYGIDYILHYYFDYVDQPVEGDLVVYSNGLSHCSPAGIYKNTKPNWNSSSGGTVESKWANGFHSPYVIQHDFFFVPALYGDSVKFYRVKEALDPSLRTPQPSDPMCTLNGDDRFVFTQTPESLSTRLEINKTRGRELLQKFPQIEREPHINISNGYFKCFYYAIGKVLKVYDLLSLPTPSKMCNDRLLFLDESILKEYFVVITEPEAQDLAVYSDDKGRALHYGVYHSKDRIESKWGDDAVYRHPPFHVPTEYGDFIKYYRLKPDLTPEIFIKTIQEK